MTCPCSQSDKKCCKICRSIIFLVVIILSIYVAIFVNSPEYFAYKICKVVKSADYEQAMMYINIDKIVENKIGNFDQRDTDSNEAGFLSNITNMVANGIKDTAKKEFESVVKSELEYGNKELKNISNRELLIFFIKEFIKNENLTKEELGKNKIKFTIKNGKRHHKSYLVEKNDHGKWEITEVPYDILSGTLGKIDKLF